MSSWLTPERITEMQKWLLEQGLSQILCKVQTAIKQEQF